jgi:hypothetical protein
MAGLLDFALGFGQGAAGAVAYDRKSQLDMQRQANLERLRAQYASEQKTAQVDQVADLLGKYRTDQDPATLDRLIAMGVDPRRDVGEFKSQNYVDPEGNPVVIDESNPDDVARIRAERLVKAGVASLTPEKPPRYTGDIMEIVYPNGTTVKRQQDHPDVAAALERGLEVRSTESQEIEGMFGQKFRVLPDGTVQRPDPTAPGGFSTFTPGGVTPEEIPEKFGTSPLAIDPDTGRFIPPGDYLSMATGPLQALQRGALATPVVGDFMAMLDDTPGAGQTRANQSMRFMQRNVVQLYRYNPERTTNMDVRDAEKLAANFGALSTTESSRNQMLELRRQIANDIAVENATLQRARFDQVPPAKLEAAKTFVLEGEALLQKIDGVFAAQTIQSGRINDKPVSQLGWQDINSLNVSTLSGSQKRALDYWISYNGWDK